MRSKLLGLLSILFLCAIGAFAQQGNMVVIRFPGAPSGTCGPLNFAVNDANGEFFDCDGGMWNSVGGGGGGGASPAAPDGSIQYNAGMGMFGAVPTSLAAGNADCDGFMDPCAFLYNYDSGAVFEYLVYGTDTDGPMGNSFDFYQYAGCWKMDSTDGTIGASMFVCPGTAAIGTGFGATRTGFETKNDFLSVTFQRFMFDTNTGQILQAADFVPSAEWGADAVVEFVRGSDNNPLYRILADGMGIGANPSVVFTFHNGAFGNTSNQWTGVCQMSDGTGDLADITWTSNTTTLTTTYNGTPMDGDTYVISCFGAVAGDN